MLDSPFVGYDPSMRRLWLWLPPLLYMGLIFLLSAQSNPLPTLTGHIWDKLLHTTEYAVLAVLLVRALRGEGLSWPAVLMLGILVTSLYGASDEWHQAFVPGRDSAAGDWVADSLGAAIGALVARWGLDAGRLRVFDTSARVAEARLSRIRAKARRRM